MPFAAPVYRGARGRFSVKPEAEERFVNIFHSHFGSHFKLMTKSEVISSGLFGPAVSGSRLQKMLGDYLAISTDRFSLYRTAEKAARNIGTHARLTEEEMRIPLIAI